MDDLGQDAAAVAAVCAGDAERYRELVERHERRVYAVAWSRLGDAQLAEEATQEAFIKGYRRLWLLGDGAKFAGWIASIARNAAINLGLRHRRELLKRERWALEQPLTAEAPENKPEDVHSPETLRETLLNLPATHRECLVLFYLEGKSGEEAALALGISETAFRVRLHRAKAVLREQLEEKLAGSLEKLRPSKRLIPAIMAAVLASSSAQAAATTGGAVSVGLGTKLLTTLGKSSLFGWVMPFMGLIGLLPGMLFNVWLARLERANFRDREGFRLRFHERLYRSFFWGFPVLMVVVWLLVNAGGVVWGVLNVFGVITFLCLPVLIFSLRLLVINRSRYYTLSTVLFSLVLLAMFGVCLGFLPGLSVCLFTGVYTFITLGQKGRPVRMDYSLFLRAAQRMLGADSFPSPPAIPALSRHEVLAFARFLGGQWLVSDFRWESQGLVLYLPPVPSSFLKNILHSFLPWCRNGSFICLHWDASVAARCGEKDFAALHAMEVGRDCPIANLEQQVEVAVGQAWLAYRKRNMAVAQRLLGEVSDDQVFLVPPVRSKATRWRQAVMLATLAPLALLLLVRYLQPQWLSDMKPVALSETQVRKALSEFYLGTANGNSLSNGLSGTLGMSFVLPAKELFTEASFQSVQEEVFYHVGSRRGDDPASSLSSLEHAWLLHKAMVGGLITLDDLGLNPDQVFEGFHRKGSSWKFVLSHRVSNDREEERSIEGLENMQLAQLRLLQQWHCLDVLNRQTLIRKLASWQVINGDAYADRPPMADWRQTRGLFATSHWPVLHDTYCVVAALDLLGGLDKIDREACIEGVLRLHHGRGFFQSTQAYENWKLKVQGDAKDTFCAFETLRILGALDRVKDLEHWQFRVRSKRKSPEVSWDEIEAWVCQQRLARVLQEHRQNPLTPIRSLLEP